MVAVQLSSENAAWLDAQGYEIAELKGFNDHHLPLYTHRAVSDKKPGDIVLRARVGNPSALDDGEAVYLARKAAHGFFPWQPGDECMQRRFQDVSYTRNGIGSTKVERSESLMGCKWCRERANETSTAKAANRRKPAAKSASRTGASAESGKVTATSKGKAAAGPASSGASSQKKQAPRTKAP